MRCINKEKKAGRRAIMAAVFAAAIILAACGTAALGESGTAAAGLSYEVEEVHITLPSATREYTLLWLSDLHMVIPGEYADPAYASDIAAREQYSSRDGMTAALSFSGWVDKLNSEEGDAIIFGGDMLDFCSPEGVDALAEGYSRLEKDYIYARADHDLLPTYLTGFDVQQAWDKQSSLCKNEGVMGMAFDDFTLIAWNNSTSNLSDSGLERIRQLVEEGKPLLLVTHVPIAPLEDSSLAEASREAFDGRVLLWGYGDCAYEPDANTRQLLDLLYADDSPFFAVLSGHLHFSWQGNISPKVQQFVFSPAFLSSYASVRLSAL